MLSERLWMFVRESADDQCTIINIVASDWSQGYPTTANVSKYVKSALVCYTAVFRDDTKNSCVAD